MLVRLLLSLSPRAILLCAFALILSIGFVTGAARAQSVDDLTKILAEELLRQRSDGSSFDGGSTLDRIRERSGERLQKDGQFESDVPASPESRLRLMKLAEKNKPSRLELDYSSRAGEALRQFGYDLFDHPSEIRDTFSGSLQDGYVLGIGDELVVTFRGQTNDIVVTRVDREGRIVLGTLPPIIAAGRKFGEVRQELEARTQLTLLGTEVYVSVGAVRVTTVVVVGEVENPGIKRLPALSTLLDAMNLAGGIKKTGSLRRIQVVRGDKTFWLDLYDLIFSGTLHQDLAIMEGDRVVVPPIGPTVAVAGWVKRAGIYELPEANNGFSLENLIDFGGGLVRPWGLRLLHLTPNAQGREQVVEPPDISSVRAREGDILLAALTDNIQLGDVSLLGHVTLPQRRSLAAAPTLRALIGNGTTIKDDAYLSFAAIRTIDKKSRSLQYYPVNLGQVLLGQQDFRLESKDAIIVFGAEDIRFLGSAGVESILSGNALSPTQECPGLNVLSKIVATDRTTRFAAAEFSLFSVSEIESRARREEERRGHDNSDIQNRRIALEERRIALEERREQHAELRTRFEFNPFETDLDKISSREETLGTCPELFMMYPDLLPFMLEHSVSLSGEVRLPGIYPIASGTTLDSLVAAAGGLTRQAYLSQIEILNDNTSRNGVVGSQRQFANAAKADLASVLLEPGEVVKIYPVYSSMDSGLVEVVGEFRRPGKYRIKRGERLSQLIERAGGLTRQGYPIGAVFTRESVRVSKKKGFIRSAAELEASFATALTKPGGNALNLAAASQAVASLVETLQSIEPVGRIVIEADPTVLQIRPDLDVILESGDRIFMPKRPNYVTVSGEVLNPSSLQFFSETRVDEYIDHAGGFRPAADEDRIFVVYPNGSAKPVSVSFWNYSPVNLLPGSTIIVPRDPTPFNFVTFAKDITQILSQIAITAASLSVLSDK